jgi:hypothetical protein
MDGPRLISKRRLVLHPLLFAAFPVLYLWGENVDQGVAFLEFLGPLAFVVGCTAAAVSITWLILQRDLVRAGLVVTVLVVLFFSYGHVYLAVEGSTVFGARVGRHAVLLPLWGGLAVGGTLLALRAGRRLPALTAALNLMAGGLVIVNVAWVVLADMQTGSGESLGVAQSGNAPGQLSLPADPPDVYYIILDAYAGEATLRETFGFSNDQFLDFLRSKGFYVADQSTVNYPRSSISISSSLNMSYHTPDHQGQATEATFLPAMRNHSVGRFLTSIGYRYIHVGSWWQFTAINPNADVNIKFGGMSEFSTVLFQTTPLYPIARRVGILRDRLDPRRREYNRVKFQFEQLAQTAPIRGPKFVFGHILCPHHPYVFDRIGNFVPEEQEQQKKVRDLYVDQLIYVNTSITELVEILLSGPSDSHPIIVLQSDEGPYPGGPSKWGSSPSPEKLKRKFRNLSAYYLPGVPDPGLYPTITPVNSFRLVFNAYFDARFPLLPDRNYVFPGLKRIRDFIDVTGPVQELVQG